MKEIRHDYKQDIINLMKEALYKGVEISSQEAIESVEQYSKTMAAGWILPDI